MDGSTPPAPPATGALVAAQDGSLVPAPPVTVCQAETGLELPVPLEADASVSLLKSVLERITGVPVASQILLLEGDKLEDHNALSEYGLPTREARPARGARERERSNGKYHFGPYPALCGWE